MTEFQAQIAEWRDLFTLSGAASATLIGLLFVSISLRSDIRQAADTSLVRSVVSHNFTMLLVVLLISLYFMVPDLTPDTLGFSILATALLPGIFFVRDFLRLRHDPEMDRTTLMWCFIIPIACLAITAIIGGMLTLNDNSETGWFVMIVAMFLVIPTKNSWELLLESREGG